MYSTNNKIQMNKNNYEKLVNHDRKLCISYFINSFLQVFKRKEKDRKFKIMIK